LEAGFLPGQSLYVGQCWAAIALAELFGVMNIPRTARQQGWLGKAAAGLHAVQGAAARTGAAGSSLHLYTPVLSRHKTSLRLYIAVLSRCKTSLYLYIAVL